MLKKINKHLKTGCEGENKAAEYLAAKGFRIMERNWRSGHKEIDIIAMDRDILVIVEVKTRKEASEQDMNEVVPLSKQQNLLEAAENYIQQNNLSNEVRFDLVFVSLRNETFIIEHFEGAFNDEI